MFTFWRDGSLDWAALLGLLAASLAILFVFGLRIVSVMFSRMTGWRDVARQFSFEGPFHGLQWSFQSAQMRHWVLYRNCLTVGANTEGLYLKAAFWLAAHPPLFVSWTEISLSRTRILFQPWREISLSRAGIRVQPMIHLQLGRELAVPFTIPKRLADQLEQAAGNRWPAEDRS